MNTDVDIEGGSEGAALHEICRGFTFCQSLKLRFEEFYDSRFKGGCVAPNVGSNEGIGGCP